MFISHVYIVGNLTDTDHTQIEGAIRKWRKDTKLRDPTLDFGESGTDKEE